MKSHLFESLESRQLYAVNYLDTAFGTSGVNTLRFRTTSTDAIAGVQLAVDRNGSSYVLARTAQTAQIRKLDKNGEVDANWFSAKRNLALFPTADGSGAEIAVDTSNRLLVQFGTDLYRFTSAGQLDTAFAAGGHLALPDFKSGVTFTVDAGNKIYVTGATGSTKAGTRMLVERFISRGKIDRTFGGTGKVGVALPAGMSGITPSAFGQAVRVFDQGTADSADDKVLVAGTLDLSGYGSGVTAARLKYDGTLDKTYGTKGVAGVYGSRNTEVTSGYETLNSIVADGTVSFTDYFTGDTINGFPSTTTSMRLTKAGVSEEYSYGSKRSSPEPDGGYLSINGGVQRFKADGTVSTSVNGGRPLNGIADAVVADVLADNNVLTASDARFSRVNVALFRPTIDPLNT